MSKYIASFFSILFPILRSAIAQVAADELDRLAHSGRRPKSRYNRPRRPEVRRSNDTHRPFQHYSPIQSSTEGFHDVLMVAFDITGRTAEQVHKWLQAQMPTPDSYPNDVSLDSWWVANDERFDRSDNDSAVFVHKGYQEQARHLLRENEIGN